MKYKTIPEDIKNYVEYNKHIGELIWIKKSAITSTIIVGDIAGSVDAQGYKVLRFKRELYKIHRIIWFLTTGKQPDEIDHIDGNKLNNTLCNLRPATNKENSLNKSILKSNTSGYKGVNYDKIHNKWIARIARDNKRIHLGYFNTPEKAHEAYCKAAEQLHGEFANFG